MATHAIGLFCFLCATVIAVMATYAKVDNQPQGTSEPDSILAKQVYDLQCVVQAQSEEVRGLKAVVESQGEEVRDLKKVVQSQGEGIQELKAVVQSQGEEVRDLRNVVQSQDEGMQELRAVVKAHREEVRGLTEVVKKQRRQLQDLRVTVQSQRALVHEVKHVVSDQGEQIEMLTQMMADSVMFEGSVVNNNSYPRRENSRNDSNNLSETLSNDKTVNNKKATENKVETETSEIRDEQSEGKTIPSTAVAADVVTRGARAAENVAFSSYLSHSIDHMGIGHTIKPDRTILNDGNSYNTLTGVFTVPVNGVYMFTFFIDEYRTTATTGVQLVVDGVPMVETAAHSADGTDNMGGNTVLLRASAGQSVWLETYRWNDALLGSNSSNRFVTFSGYLLYQD